MNKRIEVRFADDNLKCQKYSTKSIDWWMKSTFLSGRVNISEHAQEPLEEWLGYVSIHATSLSDRRERKLVVLDKSLWKSKTGKR